MKTPSSAVAREMQNWERSATPRSDASDARTAPSAEKSAGVAKGSTQFAAAIAIAQPSPRRATLRTVTWWGEAPRRWLVGRYGGG